MKFDGFEMSAFFQFYIVFSFFNSFLLILLCLLGLKEVNRQLFLIGLLIIAAYNIVLPRMVLVLLEEEAR
jgi:hypothetical protein